MSHSAGFFSQNDATVATLVIFLALACAELAWPAHRIQSGQPNRILVNFSLGLANLTLGALPLISAGYFAVIAKEHHWGLFNLFDVSAWVEFIVLLLLSSLLNYAIHVAYHKWQWLWQFHAVHHRDDSMDLSTTIRQHPLTAILGALPAGLFTMALGPSLGAVFAVRTLLFGASLFEHADIALSARVSAIIENLLVTPRLHLVHHACDRSLHDSNYGEFLTLWDHIFGTFQQPPEQPFALGVTAPSSDKGI